jgi:hypothetical protein
MLRTVVVGVGFLFVLGMGSAASAFACEVAPDQKSMTLRADNLADVEKVCSITCEVETVDGSVGTAMCSGVPVPAGASGFVLCTKERDEPFYAKAKVVESGCE